MNIKFEIIRLNNPLNPKQHEVTYTEQTQGTRLCLSIDHIGVTRWELIDNDRNTILASSDRNHSMQIEFYP